MVWRYMIDPTKTIRPGREIVVWRVDLVYLTKEDWKYEGSKASEGRGGRTQTFGLRNPAKRLTGMAVYALASIGIKGGKPVWVGPS